MLVYRNLGSTTELEFKFFKRNMFIISRQLSNNENFSIQNFIWKRSLVLWNEKPETVKEIMSLKWKLSIYLRGSSTMVSSTWQVAYSKMSHTFIRPSMSAVTRYWFILSVAMMMLPATTVKMFVKFLWKITFCHQSSYSPLSPSSFSSLISYGTAHFFTTSHIHSNS